MSLRAREEKIETGELRALAGRPSRSPARLSRSSPRKDNPRVCDVTDSYQPPAHHKAHRHKGPANVATEAYRDGWDEVFGKKPPPSAAN